MVSGDAAACGDVDLIEKRDDGFFRLMYAAGHCHAPACMSIELWNADTGELICRNVPIYGNRCGRLAGIPARTRSLGRCCSLCSPSAPGRPVPFNNSVLTPTLRALPPPIVLCSSPLFCFAHCQWRQHGGAQRGKLLGWDTPLPLGFQYRGPPPPPAPSPRRQPHVNQAREQHQRSLGCHGALANACSV